MPPEKTYVLLKAGGTLQIKRESFIDDNLFLNLGKCVYL